MPNEIINNLSILSVVPGFIILYLYVRVKIDDSLVRSKIFTIITVILSLTLVISIINTNISSELIYLSLTSLICMIYSHFDKKPIWFFVFIVLIFYYFG